MDNQQQQVAERVKEANNILVTVSANPSVDQLAACIGVTLALNKMGKHATAVFSGQVPSILEFLQPEKTIEKNTDSLRDFIIALDKSKADKLRYKVEDRVVKIFITPYRTSISDKDLEFSQGDFNVDVVLALGVHNQSDLDQAITAHGRILHDATVITLNNKTGGELGVLNWLDPTASSLSELAMQLLDLLDKSILDEQIATAMLTGIVAETDRFSNAKTTPRTMSISAELMTAGANQQLVATKLEAPAPKPEPAAPSTPAPEQSDTPSSAKKADDGTLEISHDDTKPEAEALHDEPAAPSDDTSVSDSVNEDDNGDTPKKDSPPQIHIDEHGSIKSLDDSTSDHQQPPAISHHSEAPRMILEPPTLGGQLTASGMPDAYELLPSDPLTLPSSEAPQAAPAVAPTIMPPHADYAAEELGDLRPTMPAESHDVNAEKEPAVQPEIDDNKTLSEIERDVHSSHVNVLNDQPPQTQTLPAPALPPVDEPAALPPAPQSVPSADMIPVAPQDDAVGLQDARDAVEQAINSTAPQHLPPIQALNAQPLELPNDTSAEQAQPPVPSLDMPPAAPAPAWAPTPAPATQPFQPAFTAAPAQQPPFAPGAFPGSMPAPMPTPGAQPQASNPGNPNAPPPVPPPMMPPAF